MLSERVVNATCTEKIFAGKDCNILILLITTRVSMEQISMQLLKIVIIIVINDVSAITLSVNCCNCAKIKQANTFFTCILFYIHKSGTVRFLNYLV